MPVPKAAWFGVKIACWLAGHTAPRRDSLESTLGSVLVVIIVPQWTL